MKRALLTHLQDTESTRPDGYLKACLAAGKPSADGKWIEWSDEDHARLRTQFPAPASPAHPGLGDLIERAAKPIARARKMDCLKEDGTLKPESKCAKRKAALNKLVPSIPFLS